MRGIPFRFNRLAATPQSEAMHSYLEAGGDIPFIQSRKLTFVRQIKAHIKWLDFRNLVVVKVRARGISKRSRISAVTSPRT